MFSSVFMRTLYGLRWQIAGWGVGMALITFITALLFDSFKQAGFETFIAAIPPSLHAFVGSPENYTSVPGFLGQQVFGLKITMFVLIMAIIVAFSLSANEEEDGRLQTLLALPVSRTRVFFHKLFAIALMIAVVLVCMAIGIYAGLATINKTVALQPVLESLLALWLMCWAFAMIAYGLAMGTGKRGFSVAVTSGYVIFCLVLSSLAPAVEQLKDVDTLSLLHYFNNPAIMQHGLDGMHVAILAGVGIVFTLGGWLGFTQRSLEV